MQVDEKTALARQHDLPSPASIPVRRRQPAPWRGWAVGALAFLFLTRSALHIHHHHHSSGADTGVLSESGAKCAQSPVLTPKHANLTDVYRDETKTRIINWLSGSVQIPTECFDVMGPTTGDDVDPRWKVFGDLHAYFERVYPNVYKHATVDKVNAWALAYELKGSDESKKPLFLTGHQDVVPVEPSTVGAWTHPPFSGHYDGEFIWGRGSGDDKSGMIGILSALELLLEQGFKPTRSIVLAFGFDEEAGGKVGAMYLNEFLEAKYGRDSMFMLVDEGNGIAEQFGQAFAGPAVAEKGYLDVEVRVLTPGGHSSVPPEHTGIGILARAITELEANPVPARLTRKNVLYEAYQCFAQAPKMPKHLKETVVKSRKSNKYLKQLEKYMIGLGGASKAGIWTTRAVDIVYGGVKVNALPEVSTAVVNHRINADSSVGELQDQMTSVLAPIAERLGLNFRSFGKDVSVDKANPSTLELREAYNSSLEPAPISPHDTSSTAWNLLAGSAKSTWTTSKRTKGEELVFAPGLAIGNTDTKRYWGLTKNIYRFGYATADSAFNIHTQDEHVRADAIVEGVRFFQTLILNADETEE